jgi:hypothetical protein
VLLQVRYQVTEKDRSGGSAEKHRTGGYPGHPRAVEVRPESAGVPMQSSDESLEEWPSLPQARGELAQEIVEGRFELHRTPKGRLPGR